MQVARVILFPHNATLVIIFLGAAASDYRLRRVANQRMCEKGWKREKKRHISNMASIMETRNDFYSYFAPCILLSYVEEKFFCYRHEGKKLRVYRFLVGTKHGTTSRIALIVNFKETLGEQFKMDFRFLLLFANVYSLFMILNPNRQ